MESRAFIDYDVACPLCSAPVGMHCRDSLAGQAMPFGVGHVARAREVDPATGRLVELRSRDTGRVQSSLT